MFHTVLIYIYVYVYVNTVYVNNFNAFFITLQSSSSLALSSDSTNEETTVNAPQIFIIQWLAIQTSRPSLKPVHMHKLSINILQQ